MPDPAIPNLQEMHINRNRWCIVHHLMVLYAPFQLVAIIWPREQKKRQVFISCAHSRVYIRALRAAATFQAWCYMHGWTMLMYASEAYVAWNPCLMSPFNDPLVLLQWGIV